MLLLVFYVSILASAPTGAVLEGLVTDAANGDPIPGVAVYMFLPTGQKELHGVSHTDSEGKFAFQDVAPGHFCVTADPPDATSALDEPQIVNAHPGERIDDIQLRVFRSARTISGSITDEEGKPISGAKISHDYRIKPIISDEAGHFAIGGLSGENEIQVQADGYADMLARVSGTGAVLQFRMPRLASISGQVMDTRARPVAHKVITFTFAREEESASQEGKPQLDISIPRVRQAETDDEGRFKAKGLWPGPNRIACVAEEVTRSSYSSWQCTTKCTPSRCELLAGRNPAGLMLTVTAEEDFGALQLEARDARNGMSVYDLRTDLESPKYEDGRVEARCLEPGTLRFTLKAHGYLPQRVEPVIEPGKTKTETVRMKMAAALSGSVKTDSTQDVYYGHMLQFLPGEKKPVARTDLKQNGEFELFDARAGKTLFAACRYKAGSGCERWRSKWLTLTTEQCRETVFDLTGSATISGSITSLLGCSGELVIRPAGAPDAVPWNDPVALHEQIVGKFSFYAYHSSREDYSIPDLPPGKYKVTVGWNRENKQAIEQNDERIEMHEISRSVVLKKNQTLTLDFACYEPGEEQISLESGSVPETVVEGLVTDAASAEPLRGVVVRAISRDDRDHPREIITNADGSFLFSGLPPGICYVSTVPPEGAAIFAPKHPYTYRRVEIPPGGGIKNIRFKISFVSTTLTGKIYDEQGNPIPNAQVVAKRGMFGGHGLCPREIRAISDSEGRYCMRGLCTTRTPTMKLDLIDASGTDGPKETGLEYEFRATAPGFAASAALRSLDNSTSQKLNFRLCKGARVSGRVVDSQGKPMAGKCISIYPNSYDSSIPPELERLCRVQYRRLEECERHTQCCDDGRKTDAEGKFTFDFLPPNSYALYVEPERNKTAKCSPSPLKLETGQEASQEFLVADSGDLHIDVRDALLGFISPERITRLQLTREDGSVIDVPYEHEGDGLFLFRGLPQGELTCRVEAAGCSPCEKRIKIEPAKAQSLFFRVQGNCVLTGNVAGTAESLEGRVQPIIPPWGSSLNAEIGKNGEYRLEGLHAGTYLFEASQLTEKGPSRRTQGKWITIEEGKEAHADFDLSGSASISGTFAFPKEYLGEVIVRRANAPEPIPWNDRPALYEQILARRTYGWPQELFKLTNLPAGDYKITATWFKRFYDKQLERADIHEIIRPVSLTEGKNVHLDFGEK